MSNTAIPKVNILADTKSDDQPEVDVSDEEFLQFDTSGVPVIITLTKVWNLNCDGVLLFCLIIFILFYFPPLWLMDSSSHAYMVDRLEGTT